MTDRSYSCFVLRASCSQPEVIHAR
jgi:hypothetical protein